MANTAILEHVTGNRLYPEIRKGKVIAPKSDNLFHEGWANFYANLVKQVLDCICDIEVAVLTTFEWRKKRYSGVKEVLLLR